MYSALSGDAVGPGRGALSWRGRQLVRLRPGHPGGALILRHQQRGLVDQPDEARPELCRPDGAPHRPRRVSTAWRGAAISTCSRSRACRSVRPEWSAMALRRAAVTAPAPGIGHVQRLGCTSARCIWARPRRSGCSGPSLPAAAPGGWGGGGCVTPAAHPARWWPPGGGPGRIAGPGRPFAGATGRPPM